MELTNINILEGCISDGYVLERGLISNTKSGHSILEVVLISGRKRIKKTYRDDTILEVKNLLYRKFPKIQILEK